MTTPMPHLPPHAQPVALDKATDDLRTQHHVAGGHYLVSGEGVQG